VEFRGIVRGLRRQFASSNRRIDANCRANPRGAIAFMSGLAIFAISGNEKNVGRASRLSLGRARSAAPSAHAGETPRTGETPVLRCRTLDTVPFPCQNEAGNYCF